MTKKEKTFILIVSLVISIIIISMFILIDIKIIAEEKNKIKEASIDIIPNDNKLFSFNPINNDSQEVFKEVIYDGFTEEELIFKLNKSLNSDLSGTGNIFVKRCLELGVDPYLVVSIVLYETGCKWNCSTLVKSCNNVGGVKGSPSCNGGSYKYYDSLEGGINNYIDNIYYNYYQYGLNTPELMERKYTGGSTTWAMKVNNYINLVRTA